MVTPSYGLADLRTERGCIIVVHLHAGKKCLFANTLTDSTWVLTNKTRLVAPFYDGYTYP